MYLPTTWKSPMERYFYAPLDSRGPDERRWNGIAHNNCQNDEAKGDREQQTAREPSHRYRYDSYLRDLSHAIFWPKRERLNAGWLMLSPALTGCHFHSTPVEFHSNR